MASSPAARALIWLCAAGSAALVWLALSGCGDGSDRTAVATIGSNTITRAEVEHWQRIKRAELVSSSAGAQPSAEELRQDALRFLITAGWLEKEAAARGLRVAAAETEASYRQLLNAPTGQAFAQRLKRTGMSARDELRVLRLGALAERLRAMIAASHPHAALGEVAVAVNAFISDYRRRWRSLTSCRQGYVIAECRNGPALAPLPTERP